MGRLALKSRVSNAHIRHAYNRLIHRVHKISFQHFRVNGRHLVTKEEMMNKHAQSKCTKTAEECAEERFEKTGMGKSDAKTKYDETKKVEKAIDVEKQDTKKAMEEQMKKVENANAGSKEKEDALKKLKEESEAMNEL